MSHRNRQLCQQVARATGEAYGRIARMGFSPLSDQLPDNDEPYVAPQVVDWDQLQQDQRVAWFPIS